MSALPSHTLSATVRAYLGLTQAGLGGLLGVTRGQVAHVEAGRCDFGTAAWLRLLPLLALLPPPGEGATDRPADAEEAPAALDEEPVRQRLRECEYQLLVLGRVQERAEQQQQVARRWQRVLPALLATLPPDPAADDRRQGQARRWLAARTAALADALGPGPGTALRLRALRLRSLAAEAAELRAWLANTHGTAAPPVAADSAATAH